MDREAQYATPEELIKIFRGLSIGSLANWRTAKRGPKYYKFGRKVVYKLEDVKNFLTDNVIRTLDQPD
ncbi:hypothetical protein ASZ90_008402 [hydrocarbon metagenome]|uniref:Helix-turn-helix domain-containing protein n=1 Tax=hydrocarbon metagenome TaxID=938273 RepID=A0A0W8FLL0_9ZZZZ